ncbi:MULTISPECIES: hypothetical protein [unclassified Duganella]|uniref:hypothetical protein n=1 Tax=unclassified Duganella TaxID=2636909 RepID=UPI00088AA132|nr:MULTISPECIES: hypothetical protein [unclassified Duganella]SDF80471.1 hypothetical protein SAMN05216320_1011376 [Duganella sp. OV458]SDI48775.1 hypothetical protein SAMN05428973_10139 [Duganella sp. OV510]
MNGAQLAFDFGAPTAVAPVSRNCVARDAEEGAEARAYWRVGMVTSMPLWAEVQDSTQKYTQMLPGVVEGIDGDRAAVRIYAAPEYGYWLEDYPIHKKLAVNVPLRDLGRYALNAGLERVVAAGLLATGDAALAAEVRAHHRNAMSGFTHEREMGLVAA